MDYTNGWERTLVIILGLAGTVDSPRGLERVQVGEQVFDLLVGHDLVEAFHFGPAVFDDVGYALVVGGSPLRDRYCCLKTPFRPGPFLPRVEYGSWHRSQ